MNAIEQIASVLARPAQPTAHSRTSVWQPAETKATFRNSSDRFVRAGIVAKLRDYLRENGPAPAAVLREAVGCTSGAVSAVLRHDRAIVGQELGKQTQHHQGDEDPQAPPATPIRLEATPGASSRCDRAGRRHRRGPHRGACHRNRIRARRSRAHREPSNFTRGSTHT